ncbi:MAG: C40 family peptidase [Saprospiraceae bacterium]|nr:C40 family peptidase [Saprospiraceae bacterium]
MTGNLRWLAFIGVLGLMVLISSCSGSQSYGNRSDKYARSKQNRSGRGTITYREKGRPEKAEKSLEEKEIMYRVHKANPSSTTSVKRDEIVNAAQKYLGIPYKYAGKTPQEGFDCSGFANFIYNQNGFRTAGPSHELAMMGVFKSREDLESGDLIFFGSENRISHVGIVVSNREHGLVFIHSSSSSGIKTDEVNGSEYWNSRYLFGRDLLSTLMSSN